jgi:hypothetical protein
LVGHPEPQSAILRNQISSCMGHFLYARQFLILAGFGVLLAVTARLHLLTDLNACFAVYGALHAASLVLTLRARQPAWRSCLFILSAAALSVMTLRIGMFAGRLSGALSANVAIYAVLGFSAVTGVVAYGTLIRLFGIYEWTLRLLAVSAAGCLLATYVAFFTLTHSHSLGRWWLAVWWWYAFSGGLWYCDRRQNGVPLAPSGGAAP